MYHRAPMDEWHGRDATLSLLMRLTVRPRAGKLLRTYVTAVRSVEYEFVVDGGRQSRFLECNTVG
jgi:hypothetical protein